MGAVPDIEAEHRGAVLITRFFDNLKEYMKYAENTVRMIARDPDCCNISVTGHYAFDDIGIKASEVGNGNYFDFNVNTCLCRMYGCRDQLKMLREQKFNKPDTFEQQRQEIRGTMFDERKFQYEQRLTEGDSVDVDRFKAGMERCWCGARRRDRKKKSVRIYANFCGNSTQGLLAATMAEYFESQNVNSEIWAVTGTAVSAYRVKRDPNTHRITGRSDDKNRIHLAECIRVKADNEYSDLSLINHAAGDREFFCSSEFCAECGILYQHDFDMHNIGSVMEVTADMVGLEEWERDGAIFIPNYIFSIEEAKEWMNNYIEQNRDDGSFRSDVMV